MQTTGTLTVLAGLILGLVAGIGVAPSLDPQYDWVDPTLAGIAGVLVVVGIIVSIIGRVRKGGPV